MATVNELHSKIKEHFEEFDKNHEAHSEKGNKAAGGRARKHIGEITFGRHRFFFPLWCLTFALCTLLLIRTRRHLESFIKFLN